MSVLWICADCGGEYSATIGNRDVGDESCPYCANKKILPGLNDLRTTHPDLASEWSPNNDKCLERYWKKSPEYAKWRCHICHGEYSAIIKNREYKDKACPYCNKGELLTGFNDLVTTDKHLASEWSPNNERGPDTVCHSYWLSVKWICPDCSGEYSSLIKDRDFGDDACPYCNRKAVLPGFNDLATVDPALAAEWSPNNEETPDSVRRDVRFRVRWVCPDCDGEYSAKIADREVGDEACPYCNRGNLLAGLNDLVTTDPELAKEWSQNNDKPASSVRKNYVYRALWVCPVCNSDYRASVFDREIGDNACTYCYGPFVKKGYNDLATTEPELIKEWSPNNDRTPDSVKKDLYFYALWICKTCHGEYSAWISVREVGDEACPYCADKSTLTGYNDLATVDPSLAVEWSHNNDRAIDEVRRNQKLVGLWICPTCHGEYSARIADREIGDAACLYCADKKILPGFNSFMVRHKDLMSEWLEVENFLIGINPDLVLDNDRRLVWWQCKDCGKKYILSIYDRLLKQKRGHSSCPFCNGRRIKLVHYI